MSQILKILLLSTYLFTSVAGEEVVLHLCGDGGCTEMTTACEGDCCGSEEEKSCCDDIVISVGHQQVATSEKAEDIRIVIQDVLAETAVSNAIPARLFICDKQKTEIQSPKLGTPFQDFYRKRQLVFYA